MLKDNRYLLTTTKFIAAMMPFILFGVIYNSMRYFPNYLFNDIDTEGVYNLEKMLFGITTSSGIITPNEYFNLHHCAVADVLSGILYLLWVPLPIAYVIYLFFSGQRTVSVKLACTFLMVNLIGFIGYYIHPTAPPWYVMQNGFDVVIDTPGNVAGFERFDDLSGVSIFHAIYGKNANVFAAIPSLHAAYNPVALFYAVCHARKNMVWTVILGVVSIGIWWAAVYSCHHYTIDVLLGILCVVIGIAIMELIIYRLHGVEQFLSRI